MSHKRKRKVQIATQPQNSVRSGQLVLNDIIYIDFTKYPKWTDTVKVGDFNNCLKDVNEALAILKFTPKAASPLVEKLLKSAIANAENNHNMDASKLYVAEIYANQGATMKRIRAATQGRANRIRKRTSHIEVVLKERD